ncbi:intradiol ring-cleavage dioxygenase [Antrihabitans sp. YC3-6]|uniref:Intradiol ring-cleavage dioxygenase n=1 Tax=Antrihabitans stalagmiti TaxID=2799499 RepID=A0A934U736_9NOCA|nr:intradiol ring-cleavage dioxygenase [Antrihabitans stalagmiti]MBJ8342603.1 intradiol ring-cleavage dioxygenase [Antrihabitans stalagmiti]
MNDDIERSRRRISRRRALTLGGAVGLGGVLTACAADSGSGSPATGTATATTSATSSATTAGSTVEELLARAPQCALSKEETQGPYWFDVDSIRNDLREDRPGTTFVLALRVQDGAMCAVDPSAGGIANAVVEIWHCDAGGVYSGFESGSSGGPGGGRPGQSSTGGETSDGSYSSGDQEATPTDDATYLRGAQTTDANGIAQFTTIFPGWYPGRAAHIHLKVHVDRKTVLTSQLFFEETLLDEVYATAPYNSHTGSRTTNASDNIYDATGLVTTASTADGYLGAINLAVER